MLFNLSVPQLLSRILILVISLTVHEFAHAYVAHLFGDDTAKRAGRLSLNPAHHLDLMGSIMFLVSGFGWARPVPVDGYAVQRRSPAGLMWVSLAGPMSNFLLAILAAIPLRFGLLPISSSAGGMFPSAGEFAIQFLLLNLGLMLFNLIPLPPLDGSSIAEYFFPPSWARVVERMRPYGPIILLAVLFGLPYLGVDVLGTVMSPVMYRLFYLLVGG